MTKKCLYCCIGTGMDCYYDYGGEFLIPENCIDLDRDFFKKLDVLVLYNYCPYCGNNNHLERYRGFIRDGLLEDYIISGKVEEG